MPLSRIWLRRVVIVLVVVAAMVAAWQLTRPDPPEVELATVAWGPVESTVVSTRGGTIKACRRANLAPVLGGQIVKLWVKEGDRVAAGQPLLELWNRDLAAQLAERNFVSPRRRCAGRGARAKPTATRSRPTSSAPRRRSASLAGLERTTLTALFAGIVARVTGEVGEFTTPSPPGIPRPPAVDLIDDSCVYVSAPTRSSTTLRAARSLLTATRISL